MGGGGYLLSAVAAGLPVLYHCPYAAVHRHAAAMRVPGAARFALAPLSLWEMTNVISLLVLNFFLRACVRVYLGAAEIL